LWQLSSSLGFYEAQNNFLDPTNLDEAGSHILALAQKLEKLGRFSSCTPAFSWIWSRTSTCGEIPSLYS